MLQLCKFTVCPLKAVLYLLPPSQCDSYYSFLINNISLTTTCSWLIAVRTDALQLCHLSFEYLQPVGLKSGSERFAAHTSSVTEQHVITIARFRQRYVISHWSKQCQHDATTACGFRWHASVAEHREAWQAWHVTQRRRRLMLCITYASGTVL